MKTAEQYRADAAAAEERKEASFQRSDTDGFVSQWASGMSARLSRVKAEIVENGGVSDFIGLYEGDRRVKAKLGYSEYGSYWLLHDDEAELIAERGKKFLPTGPRSRILKQMGLKERWEVAPAWADYGAPAGATGLSGATQVYIDVYRSGDKWGGDATLTDDNPNER